jgi:hypothetical protein
MLSYSKFRDIYAGFALYYEYVKSNGILMKIPFWC